MRVGRSIGAAALLATVACASLVRGLTGALPPRDGARDEWRGWRGNRRDGISAGVPQSLRSPPKIMWRRSLTAHAMGGVAATRDYVVVSDKSLDGARDIWRCFRTGDGKPLWHLEYAAAGRMDYTNTPRATPMIWGDTVYILGAFGHLRAARLSTGKLLWSCDLVRRFGGSTPTWGFCATPLIVDGKIVVFANSVKVAVAALDARTGTTVWATPGDPIGYGSAILATFAGRRQIVGHGKSTLSGWDPDTGACVWSITPPERNDFNVPTPTQVGDRLLVATENNGTRLYAFDGSGRIKPDPVAHSSALCPNTASPVVVDGMVWGIAEDGLFCLSIADGLRTVWKRQVPPFLAHGSLIAGNGRVLIATRSAELVLMPSAPRPNTEPKIVPICPEDRSDEDVVLWSHPALVGTSLYVRTSRELLRVELSSSSTAAPSTSRPR